MLDKSKNYAGLYEPALNAIRLLPPIRNYRVVRVFNNIRLYRGSAQVKITNSVVTMPSGTCKCRRYVPLDRLDDSRLIVYFHGGGFVYGGLNTVDGALRDMCVATGCQILSVGYPLAPQFRYPVAMSTCTELVRTLVSDQRPLVLMGDSAGGNIALGVAMRMVGEGVSLGGLVLLYPYTEIYSPGIEAKYPSMSAFDRGFLLEVPQLDYMARRYLAPTDNPMNPAISPIYGDMRGLPPSLVFVCGFDPLRDMGIATYRALADHGVDSRLVVFDDIIHGYMTVYADYISPTIDQICAHFAFGAYSAKKVPQNT